jgi:hypothetical protein
MRRKFYLSPLLPLVTFFGFFILLFLINGLPTLDRIPYTLLSVGIVGAFVLFAWGSVVITIEGDTITRRLGLFYVTAHKLSDVREVRDTSDSDAYSTLRYTEVRFADRDKWNLVGFAPNDLRDLKQLLGRHSSTHN